MPEVITLRDLRVNYTQTLASALAGGTGQAKASFIPFRVQPRLKTEDYFPPKFGGEDVSVTAHFFQVPAGYALRDLPNVMDDRCIRGPKDIREILALSQVIDEQRCEFAIYAPEIGGRDDTILVVERWPDWPGLGLIPSTVDPEVKNLWDYQFIGFSEG